MIENPFESGHIKNYVLLYVSVVVIVILFFIASSFFHEIEEVQTKVFNTVPQEEPVQKVETPVEQSRFKLLEKSY